MQTGFSQQLEDYQWKNRLLILVAKEENPKKNTQSKIFAKEEAALNDCELIVLHKPSGDEELLSAFHIEPAFEGVLLIGKDGGLKFKKPFLVEPETIFSIIDQMPMRRAEMRRKQSKN